MESYNLEKSIFKTILELTWQLQELDRLTCEDEIYEDMFYEDEIYEDMFYEDEIYEDMFYENVIFVGSFRHRSRVLHMDKPNKNICKFTDFMHKPVIRNGFFYNLIECMQVLFDRTMIFAKTGACIWMTHGRLSGLDQDPAMIRSKRIDLCCQIEPLHTSDENIEKTKRLNKVFSYSVLTA